MIAKTLRLGTTLLVYFCLATVIAEGILLVWLGSAWQVNRSKLIQALAVLQDVDLFAIRQAAEGDQDELSSEQVSYEQVIETRALSVYHLELREQALKNGLAQLQTEQRELTEDQQRYQKIRDAFDVELTTIQEREASEGMDVARSELEALKPKQAKLFLLDMLEKDEINDVVALLEEMPTVKAAKIIGEFETAEEIEKIGEVLRSIRQGSPIAELAADTRDELQKATAAQP